MNPDARPGYPSGLPAHTRAVVKSLKETLLADRLLMPHSDVQALLQAIQSDLSVDLDVPARAIAFDMEFLGRTMDLIFTLHRQNLPKE